MDDCVPDAKLKINVHYHSYVAKKTKELKREGMDNIAVKLFFTLIFFMMGFSIIGAGIGGQEATAPIVITIGMMMVMIGLAPYYVPILYDKYVPQDSLSKS